MRLIDADALKKNIPEFRNPIREGFEERNQGWNHCLDTIHNLIDEQPTINNWIPVSERLPDIGERVLISKVNGHIDIDYVDEEKRWHWVFDDWVVAWMPLSEPYKESDNE